MQGAIPHPTTILTITLRIILGLTHLQQAVVVLLQAVVLHQVALQFQDQQEVVEINLTGTLTN